MHPYTHSQDLPCSWPGRGDVEFDNVYLRYGDGDAPVLRGVSFLLCGGRKLGVVGRTGAGKSTIAAALFRLVEISSGMHACNPWPCTMCVFFWLCTKYIEHTKYLTTLSCDAFVYTRVPARREKANKNDLHIRAHIGTIRVGGIDTKSLGLHTLRRAMAIIPQEPQLFSGPLRAVLDPFDEYNDPSVWGCLEQVC
jgi:ABC-type multidrug transport system fused ATPase/permease subunit